MFIRYNSTAKYYEYDTSAGQTGAGPWLILPIDFAQIYNPPVIPPPYTLPANVALLDRNNQVFTGLKQTFAPATDILDNMPQFKGALPGYHLWETDQAVDAKITTFAVQNGTFVIQSRTDIFGFIANIFFITRTGDVTLTGTLKERSRTVPLGEWISVPFNAANFFGTGGLVWTVSAANVITNRYMLVGKTVTWTLWLQESVLTGSPGGLQINLPTGIVPAFNAFCPTHVQNAGWKMGQVVVAPGGSTASLITVDYASWVVSGASPYYVQFTFSFEIQ